MAEPVLNGRFMLRYRTIEGASGQGVSFEFVIVSALSQPFYFQHHSSLMFNRYSLIVFRDSPEF